MRYQSINKTAYLANNHLVWCPNHRRVLAGGIDARLKAILAEVVAEVGTEVIEIEATPDHMHLLAEELPPTVPLSEFVRLLKRRSARLMRMEFRRLRRLPVLWSPSWFVSTDGGAPLGVACRDVGNQKAVAAR
jgi:putative transposase